MFSRVCQQQEALRQKTRQRSQRGSSDQGTGNGPVGSTLQRGCLLPFMSCFCNLESNLKTVSTPEMRKLSLRGVTWQSVSGWHERTLCRLVRGRGGTRQHFLGTRPGLFIWFFKGVLWYKEGPLMGNTQASSGSNTTGRFTSDEVYLLQMSNLPLQILVRSKPANALHAWC